MSKDAAFVYIWQDARQKPHMYYLGYHKGTPDDNYTHSSTVFESFTKDTIPTGVTRRIIASGSNSDMIALETKLLKNRKEKRWQQYYNMCANEYPYMWEDPEFRAMQSEKAKQQWEDPEYRAMQSENSKKRWEDPEYRAKRFKKHTCTICGFVSNKTSITRWHNDNCKHKK